VYEKTRRGSYQLVSPVSRLADPYVRTSYADLLSTTNTAESADIVLIYDENTMTETPNFIQVKRKGDHGGATWGAQHIPMMVAGPGFKRGYTSSYPARLADIAPTIESAMNIRPRGQDGVPLADAMVKPPGWAVKQQRMLSDVRGLENEAAVRPNIRR
jgi:arylsulfatase A-like enzyme